MPLLLDYALEVIRILEGWSLVAGEGTVSFFLEQLFLLPVSLTPASPSVSLAVPSLCPLRPPAIPLSPKCEDCPQPPSFPPSTFSLDSCDCVLDFAGDDSQTECPSPAQTRLWVPSVCVLKGAPACQTPSVQNFTLSVPSQNVLSLPCLHLLKPET